MRLTPFGEEGLRIVFGNTVSYEVHSSVRRCFLYLQSLHAPFIKEIIPSFCSCLVIFDDEQITAEDLAAFLTEQEAPMAAMVMPEPLLHEIPVRYGGDDGPDCHFVCRHTGLTLAEVVAIHSSVTYTVFTVGFSPGFPYLGILDPRLHVPRLATPRLAVPAGSVGMALNQTGIYPFTAPGGWQIIGRTERVLFDPTRPPYSLLQMGDLVRFCPVAKV
ncbi:MAG: 5-oxoprolinase subunit PxpB [Syntrophales bacterium]|nr:5-oxoprolinase subunit PxpB [Syntrophales bacterium]